MACTMTILFSFHHTLACSIDPEVILVKERLYKSSRVHPHPPPTHRMTFSRLNMANKLKWLGMAVQAYQMTISCGHYCGEWDNPERGERCGCELENAWWQLDTIRHVIGFGEYSSESRLQLVLWLAQQFHYSLPGWGPIHLMINRLSVEDRSCSPPPQT